MRFTMPEGMVLGFSGADRVVHHTSSRDPSPSAVGQHVRLSLLLIWSSIHHLTLTMGGLPGGLDDYVR
jgi:hypothetical protein